LVMVTYTSRVAGCTATHSGRSMGVAPTASAAWRVLTSNSPISWLNRSPSVPPASAGVSSLRGTHSPVPMASPSVSPARKRATYNVPRSSSRRFSAGVAGSYLPSDTNLYTYSLTWSSPMYTTTRPSSASDMAAFSCLKRPRAVSFLGVELGSNGSISTTQPKRLYSFGSSDQSNRVSCVSQRYELLDVLPLPL